MNVTKGSICLSFFAIDSVCRSVVYDDDFQWLGVLIEGATDCAFNPVAAVKNRNNN